MSHPNSKKAKAAKAKRAEARRERVRDGSAASSEKRHEENRVAEIARRQRKDRMAKVRNVVGGFVVVALIAGFVRYVAWPDPELAGVVKVSSDGDGHVDGARYESETPTSGEHDASAPSCGTRSEQLDAPLAVHALEHGTVLVWYDSAQPDIGAELTELMSEWDSHVIVSPHSDLEAPIVATAWNRLKEYDEVEPEISEFISVYRNRGPEKVSCDY